MNFDIPRERLEGLMLFRVVLATLFLGGSLAVDVEAMSDFSDVRNATIVGLIVTTYALTIFYAVLIRRVDDLAPLAVTQITLDLFIVLVLADVTGGLDSPFLFLFLVTAITAAIVLGRRPAIFVAAAVTAALLILAAQRLGLADPVPAPGWVWKDSILRVSLNASAALIVAVLSGYLAERLGEATSQLERQQVSIRELKALNRNILESLSSGLLTVDAEGTVIFFNRAAEQITGYTSDEVLGQTLAEVLPDIARFIADESDDSRQESTYERADGSRVFLGFSTSALQNADQEEVGRIVIFQDLSDIKRLEEKMRRSERLAAVGKLSAAIAHEIRNPLASISGSVEMLSVDEEISEDDRTLMRIIVREVDRLDDLISEFLQYSSPSPLTLTTELPRPIVETVLELFRPRTGEVDLQLELDDVPPLLLDSEAFQQVLWNLLNNAADAIEENGGGRVRVALRSEEKDVVLSVADDGPGIAEENRDRIFQPFFTTRDRGTGLGLATIYRIVEEHGAQISVEPQGELGGAEFEVRFRTA